MDMSLGELWELVMEREAWRASIMGWQRVGHDWETELKCDELNISKEKGNINEEISYFQTFIVLCLWDTL